MADQSNGNGVDRLHELYGRHRAYGEMTKAIDLFKARLAKLPKLAPDATPAEVSSWAAGQRVMLLKAIGGLTAFANEKAASTRAELQALRDHSASPASYIEPPDHPGPPTG